MSLVLELKNNNENKNFERRISVPKFCCSNDFKFTFYNPNNCFENWNGLPKVVNISEFLLS